MFFWCSASRTVLSRSASWSEGVLGDRRERAVFADERLRAGGEVQVAGAELAGVDEQLAHALGEAASSIVPIWSRETAGRRRSPAKSRRGGAGGGRGRGRGFIVQQRIARRRAGGGAGHGLAGHRLEFLDVLHQAVVDELLGKVHQLGLRRRPS